MIRRAALPLAPLSWPLLPAVARALLIVTAIALGPAIGAHPAYGPIETSEVRLNLQAQQIVVSHDGAHLAINFTPSGGAIRARLLLPAGYERAQVRLQVSLPKGEHIDVRFLGTGRVRMSNHPLTRIPDRSVLELRQPQRTHRIVLRDGNPQSGKTDLDPR